MVWNMQLELTGVSIVDDAQGCGSTHTDARLDGIGWSVARRKRLFDRLVEQGFEMILLAFDRHRAPLFSIVALSRV